MSSNNNKEICLLCENKYSSRGLTRHLKSCLKTFYLDGKKTSFLLFIEDGELFWVYVVISSETTLTDLDEFLRELWLECCGHLSSFEIGNEYYNSPNPYMNKEDKDMNFNIEEIFSPGLRFGYVYDFGSSTYLKMDVKAELNLEIFEGIQLIARNRFPEILCWVCEKELVSTICSECMLITNDYLFCDSCKSEHSCGDNYYLKFVNSPRVGTCAYQ